MTRPRCCRRPSGCAPTSVSSIWCGSETAVEGAFKSLKSIDLLVRPIRHRLEDRVRTHIFLCMLTYYVQRYMREAWRPLLFADEDQDRQ